MRIDHPAQDLIHFSKLEALGLTESDTSKLSIIRGPILEQCDSLLFLSSGSLRKLQPGEFSLRVKFDELTEYGLRVLMQDVFASYEKKHKMCFRNVYEALDTYHFSCLNYNKVAPIHTSIEVIISSDDFWVDLNQITNPKCVYLNDGLLNDYEYREDSKYSCHDAKYFNSRCQDTLAGWTYTIHNNSFCLTPPTSWHKVPKSINVNWYKRPLYWSLEHKGYFVSNDFNTLAKIRELGALYDPNY
mgnify:CR=1 FL=1